MTSEIKLISLDLDGTLLQSSKELSGRNYRALEAAAARGIHIVPTTGRMAGAMPDAVRQLPFVRYVISVNGAQVTDLLTGQTLYRADVPLARALEIMQILKALPVIHDCYLDDHGWMSERDYAQIGEYISDPALQSYVRKIRSPVADLCAFVTERGKDPQKLQMFFRSKQERLSYEPQLRAQMPDMSLTSSLVNNIEINHRAANKGAALTFLCNHLGFDVRHAMCFGDGSNDISMLRAAGVGVAMENAEDIVKQAADAVTAHCDDDGVARYLEAHVLV